MKTFLTAAAVAALTMFAVVSTAHAETPEHIDRSSDAALQQLYDTNPAARAIAEHARAILVFPSIVKAGFVVGGAFGEGELKEGSEVRSYYNSVTGSVGFQAGAQSYGYVVFLMNQDAVRYVHRSEGWEVGVGPTIVIVDAGVAGNLSTTTLKDDAYAFIFDQKGLMAGVSLEGTKITPIDRMAAR